MKLLISPPNVVDDQLHANHLDALADQVVKVESCTRRHGPQQPRRGEAEQEYTDEPQVGTIRFIRLTIIPSVEAVAFIAA